VVGDSFSLVDVHLAGWVGFLGMCGFDAKRWPNVDAWAKKCMARPGHAASMAP
jgi:glutathione S-transferase